MGLATIDPHSQKKHSKIHKSLVSIRLVLTEIQAFKNEKNLQRNIWKCGQIRTRVWICPHFHLGVLFLTMWINSGKTYAHASTLTFPVCTFFWYHIYLAANFTKFDTKNLLYCCNRSLSKSMLPFSSISFNFLVRRFRKSLQQSKAVRTRAGLFKARLTQD